MSDSRNPSIYIGTGQQGVGKTYRTMQEIDEYIKTHKNRCGIIFDVNNEFGKYKTIDVDVTASKAKKGSKTKTEPNAMAIMRNVKRFWMEVKSGKRPPEIRRILPYRKNRQPMTMEEKQLVCSLLLEHAKYCFILLEDWNTYVSRASSTRMVGALLNKRHKNQDIIMHFQTLDKLDPMLLGQVNIIRMHHQPSGVKRIAYKLPNPDLFEIAKRIVDNECHNKSYDNHNRFFVYIHPQDNKIVVPTALFPQCNATPEQLFREGCEIYIGDEYNTTVKPYLKKIDMGTKGAKGKGSSKHTPDSAVEAFINDKMRFLSK